VQFLLIVASSPSATHFICAIFAVEFSTTALALRRRPADRAVQIASAGDLAVQRIRCSASPALVIAVLHVMRPSIVLLTLGLIAAGLGIVLYNIALSGLAIGLLILGCCTARARHSVSASSTYIAQLQKRLPIVGALVEAGVDRCRRQ